MEDRQKQQPTLRALAEGREQLWINPELRPFAQVRDALPLGERDVEDAAARLERFAPFLMRVFPETRSTGGLIESPLREIEATRRALAAQGPVPGGRLFLKLDSDLAVAGSVKARGGIYEVLRHTEELALAHGILEKNGDYASLADHRDFFSRYTVQVGSTGNLGLSIGIMSAAVGYRAIVHMSADARQWKKDLLRAHGVEVREYPGDYGAAVARGRELSNADPRSYFVDDEHSQDLFLGYAAAGRRLAAQLREQHITVDGEHPLFVTIPCGVGGAPGGIAFGLKLLYGECVRIFFAEPVQSPCMLAGLASGRGADVCVQDFGLTGKTEADGLAVSRPSGFVCGMVRPLLSGEVTVADARLYDDLRTLHGADGLFIEPSACAAFGAFRGLARFPEGRAWLESSGLAEKLPRAVHILWATGGRLVPEPIRADYLEKRL
jgi:D-serine dehydratase